LLIGLLCVIAAVVHLAIIIWFLATLGNIRRNVEQISEQLRKKL